MSTIKEAWEWLRKFGTKDDKERFRPVYIYIQTLERKLDKMQKEIDKLKAPSMFDKKLEAIEANTLLNMSRLRETPKMYAPLSLRLKIMYENNQAGSQEWISTLKWNKLTEQEAMELVKKEQHEQQEVSRSE
jgi:CRP-like cAMP-binding protein